MKSTAGEDSSGESPRATQCPSIVADYEPSTVRAKPENHARKVGSLLPGTPLEVVERDGAWARIEAPVAGWIHTSLLYDACTLPPVWVGQRIEGRLFILFAEESGEEDQGKPTMPYLGQVRGEEFPQRETFYAEPLSQDPYSLEVTTIPFDGGKTCHGKTIGPRLRLIGRCAGSSTQTWWAVEVDCKSNSNWNLVVGGHHRDLSVSPWGLEPAELTAAQQATIEARGFSLEEAAVSQLAPPYGYTLVEIDIDDSLLLRDSSIVAKIWTPQISAPRRLRVDAMHYAIFETGYHGYGFNVVPAHRPRQQRGLGYPMTSCGAY